MPTPEQVVENYRRFVQSLPEPEKDLPYITAPSICEKSVLSPQEVLDHMGRRTPCGEKLIEMRR